MAPELPNSVFRSAILDLLASIRNQSPGDIQEQFTGPPDFWPGGFRLEWWVGEQDILLRAALTLAEVVPGVLERHTVQVVRNKILSTLKAKVDHFNWAPFISIARGPVVSLLECVKPGAVEAIVSALTTWAAEVDKAMFLMPVRGLRPASDVLSSTFLWVSCNTAPKVLSTVLHLPVLPDTLASYPPWLTGPKSGQQTLGDGDSLLGIVAPGWQDGVSELRRVAGAICCAVPDAHVLFRSIPYWSNVFLLSEAGAQVLNAFAPILPNVGNVRVLHAPELDVFRAIMAPRVDAEHDRRFRIALQFLSTGWVLPEHQSL
jgi:hypothetical protein